MPYIERNARLAIDASAKAPENAGELNYRLTSIILRYPTSQPARGLHIQLAGACRAYLLTRGELRYQSINDVLGALDGASREYDRRVRDEVNCDCVKEILSDVADEFYQSVAAPYEDKKIAENGDISYAPGSFR